MLNKRKTFSILLVAVLLISAVPVFVLAQDTATSLTPASQTIAIGETAIVTLHVENVENLYGYQANLQFNQAVVQVVDADAITPGIQVEVLDTFLQPEMVMTNIADNTAGTIMCTVMQISPTLPVSGTGDLLAITFQGVANGLSDISFTDLTLFDQAGDPITTALNAAQVEVSELEPTPTPTEEPPPEPTPEPTPEPSTMGNLLKGIAVDLARNLVYVAVQSDNTIAIWNGWTYYLAAKVPCGGIAPSGLALSEDGSKLFVVNSGSDQVAVLNANNSYEVIATIDVGSKPYGIAIANGIAYVTNFDAQSVSLIDVNTMGVINTVTVGWHPALPAATGDHAYIPNHSAYLGWRSKDPAAEWEYIKQHKGWDTGLSIVHANGDVENILQEYIGFFAVAVDEVNERVYITKRDGTAEGLYVLNLVDNGLLKFVPMLRPYAVAVNSETHHVFIVQGDMDEVYVLDAEDDYRLIRAVNTDPNNGNIPDMLGGYGIGVKGNEVYVANYAAGTLTIFNDPDPSSNFAVPIDTEYIRGWMESGGNHGPLGEPTAPSYSYWYSEQQYERGSMHWRQVVSGTNQVYVLDNESNKPGGTDWMGRDSGIWDQFDDGWSPGMPLFPEGCSDAWWPYGPMFGFGVAWCNEEGIRGRVKDVIGYPIGWEYGTVGGDQTFANGTVFWNPASDAYYVLRNDNHRWRYYRAHRRYSVDEIEPNVTGRINLQGRADNQGVILSSLAGPHTTTDESGSFGLHFEGQMDLYIRHRGYLDVVATIKANTDAHLDVGEITLVGGDINSDNRIDILDISYIGYHFADADVLADINGDGIVDILDLSMVGANFGQVGPIHWER